MIRFIIYAMLVYNMVLTGTILYMETKWPFDSNDMARAYFAGCYIINRDGQKCAELTGNFKYYLELDNELLK